MGISHAVWRTSNKRISWLIMPTNSTTIHLQQQESRRVRWWSPAKFHSEKKTKKNRFDSGFRTGGSDVPCVLTDGPTNVLTDPLPLRFFMCETAIRRMVSLSGLRASVEHVGTMSQSSLMYVVILFRLRRSISQCDSLAAAVLAQKESIKSSHTCFFFYYQKLSIIPWKSTENVYM